MMLPRAVRLAAQELDTAFSAWPYLIDHTRLDMSSCTDCVLGQVFGDFFADEAAMIRHWVMEEATTGRTPATGGNAFQQPAPLQGWLRRRWVREIRIRTDFIGPRVLGYFPEDDWIDAIALSCYADAHLLEVTYMGRALVDCGLATTRKYNPYEYRLTVPGQHHRRRFA